MNTTMLLSSSSRLFNPVLPTGLHIQILPAWMSANRRRGFESENLVEQALRRMQEKDYGLGFPIKSFVHAPPNSPMDRRQIDFSVLVREGLEVMLQIKNSDDQRRKCEKRMERLGRLIIVITVKAYENVERVVHKVVKGVKLALSKMRRANDGIVFEHGQYDPPRRKDRFFRFHVPRMCH